MVRRRQALICQQFLNRIRDRIVAAVCEEIFGEMLACKRTLRKLFVQTRKNGYHIVVGHLFHLVQNLLVSLLGNDSLLRITAAARCAE